MFVYTAYDPALAESTGTPAASLDDCLIRCHEIIPCEAVIMASQLDSHGNNCYLYQKRKANLTLIWGDANFWGDAHFLKMFKFWLNAINTSRKNGTDMSQ